MFDINKNCIPLCDVNIAVYTISLLTNVANVSNKLLTSYNPPSATG